MRGITPEPASITVRLTEEHVQIAIDRMGHDFTAEVPYNDEITIKARFNASQVSYTFCKGEDPLASIVRARGSDKFEIVAFASHVRIILPL